MQIGIWNKYGTKKTQEIHINDNQYLKFKTNEKEAFGLIDHGNTIGIMTLNKKMRVISKSTSLIEIEFYDEGIDPDSIIV